MRRLINKASIGLLVAIHLMLSSKPAVMFFDRGGVLTVIRYLLLAAVWCGAGYAFYKMYDRHCDRRRDILSHTIESSLNNFFNALVKFSAGDISAGIEYKDSFGSAEKELAGTIDLLKQSVEEFNGITATPVKRVCFTGDNSFQEGLQMGECIKNAMGGKGRLLIIIPFFSQVLHALRAKGCISYLNQNAKGIEILPVVEGSGNADQTVKILSEVMRKHSSADGIYLTDGVTPLACRNWLDQNGYKIQMFAHDISDENIELLHKGKIECLLAENFFAQTYNAIMYLYNSLESGWKPISFKIYLDPLVITKDNYKLYWDFERGSRVLSEGERSVLQKPVENKSKTKWKITAVLPTATSFFVMGTEGAKAAARELQKYGVHIDIVDAFKDWDSFGAREAMEPHILAAQEQGVDGITTAIFDRHLVPVINSAVKKGVKVTTFNSEPLSLREIIYNVSENMVTLQNSSSELATSAEESARANNQIVKVMNSIEQSTAEQNSQLENADRNIGALNDVITNVTEIVDKYLESVNEMNSEVGRGVEQISDSNRSFQDLRESSRRINDRLLQLQEDMGRIRKIISTIDTFSTDTNVLAINASIQAARAGERGKAFSVVAKEIRSLSEKSTQATEEISSIIESVLASVKGVVDFSKNNVETVEANTDRLSQVNSAFQVISQHLENSSESVRGIHESIESVATSSGSIKEAMNQISNENRTNLGSIQEITESLRELAVQSTDLSTMAARYLELANSQEKVISQLTY